MARSSFGDVVARGLPVALFLGAILAVIAVSGCEFVYLPECDTQCQAGGGNDSYGGLKQ